MLEQAHQQFRAGNKAIRDHADDGRALRGFKGVRGEVRYLGEFRLASPAYDLRPAHESGSDTIRQVIVFHLQAVDLSTAVDGAATAEE